MSQYFTGDFADFTTCTGADCGGWTKRIKTTPAWTPSNPLSITQATSLDWAVLSWDALDGDTSRGDVEVLFVGQSTAYARYCAILRGAGTDEAAVHYVLRVGGTSLRVDYCNGSDTPTQIASVVKTHNVNTDYWFRLRVNGSGPTSIKAKSWSGLITDEPAGWDIDTTDSSGPTAAGWIGFGDYSLGGGFTVSQFGVGTNGDTAPDAAPSGGADLVVSDGAHAHAADNLALTTSSTLTIQDATHGHSADAQTLSTAAFLAIADAAHGHAADNVALSASGSASLTVNDSTHAHAADALALTTASSLSIADSTHAHAADNVALSTAGSASLSINDAAHGHAADGLVLTTSKLLTIDDAIHAQQADNVGFTTQSWLFIQDAAHAHRADNVPFGGGPTAATPGYIASATGRSWRAAGVSRSFVAEWGDR